MRNPTTTGETAEAAAGARTVTEYRMVTSSAEPSMLLVPGLIPTTWASVTPNGVAVATDGSLLRQVTGRVVLARDPEYNTGPWAMKCELTRISRASAERGW